MPDTGRRRVDKPQRSKPAPKLSPLERYARGRKIAAMRAREKPIAWREVAKEVGMSEGGAKEAYAQFLDWEEPLHDPSDAVQETIDGLTVAMHEAFRSVGAMDVDAPGRTQAIRTAVDTLVTRMNVMQRAGRLPRSLAAPQVGQQMQLVLREFAAMLARHDVGDDVMRDFLTLAESQIGRVNAIEGRELPSAA